MHITLNQDFDGVKGDLEGVDGDFGAFRRGVWIIDIDTGLSSVLAGRSAPRAQTRWKGWKVGRGHLREGSL